MIEPRAVIMWNSVIPRSGRRSGKGLFLRRLFESAAGSPETGLRFPYLTRYRAGDARLPRSARTRYLAVGFFGRPTATPSSNGYAPARQF